MTTPARPRRVALRPPRFGFRPGRRRAPHPPLSDVVAEADRAGPLVACTCTACTPCLTMPAGPIGRTPGTGPRSSDRATARTAVARGPDGGRADPAGGDTHRLGDADVRATARPLASPSGSPPAAVARRTP